MNFKRKKIGEWNLAAGSEPKQATLDRTDQGYEFTLAFDIDKKLKYLRSLTADFIIGDRFMRLCGPASVPSAVCLKRGVEGRAILRLCCRLGDTLLFNVGVEYHRCESINRMLEYLKGSWNF